MHGRHDICSLTRKFIASLLLAFIVIWVGMFISLGMVFTVFDYVTRFEFYQMYPDTLLVLETSGIVGQGWLGLFTVALYILGMFGWVIVGCAIMAGVIVSIIRISIKYISFSNPFSDNPYIAMVKAFFNKTCYKVKIVHKVDP